MYSKFLAKGEMRFNLISKSSKLFKSKEGKVLLSYKRKNPSVSFDHCFHPQAITESFFSVFKKDMLEKRSNVPNPDHSKALFEILSCILSDNHETIDFGQIHAFSCWQSCLCLVDHLVTKRPLEEIFLEYKKHCQIWPVDNSKVDLSFLK